jgi:hypothetical protein
MPEPTPSEPPGASPAQSPRPSGEQPIAHLPILAGFVLCACIAAMPLGFFAAGIAGEAAPDHSRLTGPLGPSASAVLGAFVAFLGVAAALLLLAPGSMRSASRLGVAVVVASMARLLLAASVGMVLWEITRPERAAYIVALVAGVLLATTAEAVWGVSALRRHDAAMRQTKAGSP